MSAYWISLYKEVLDEEKLTAYAALGWRQRRWYTARGSVRSGADSGLMVVCGV